ncbi:ABC-F family ATP-binding cassette domain-containing protein [Kribbella lupini]|uniref:ABC-F family ATP-binding cassette domain-containing protein n=1 Tax=Kribbella lupini TaxID=291602 RepID=A0ABN2BRY0_9ACTN
MPFSALVADGIVRVLGSRRVLDGVSLTASPGRRIGLIGENGAGKSTLLRILAGADAPDRGHVIRPADLGYLPQELSFDSTSTLTDVLDEALHDAHAVLAELARLADALGENPELLTAYADQLAYAEDHEAWDADRRADLVLTGLGLADIPRSRRLSSLSGGQRARLALAALLIRRPTALLLDEPTNHLDDAAIAFLEEQLKALPGVVLVATHDRALLDAVCTDLIDVDPALDGPTRHGGNYTAYQSARRAALDRWRRQYAEEQAELSSLREAATVTAHQVAPGRLPRDNEKMGQGHTTGRVQNQIARRTRAATRRLDALTRSQIPAPPEPLQFRSLDGSSAAATDGEPLLSLRNLRVPHRLHLEHLDLHPGDHLLITGPNGAGKSTLLSVLAGHLPFGGTLHRHPDLTVALLTQDTTWADPARTARDTYALAVGNHLAEQVPLSSLGLLPPYQLDQPVNTLSVGQRRRLALALVVADPPDLLLLDEPTNHLSPTLTDELEDALTTTLRTVVVATHDRHLRTRWTGRTLQLGR